MLEREVNTGDIFTCSLGNLCPGEEATLKLCYVQALTTEPDGAVRFVLPAVLNPRYVPQGKYESASRFLALASTKASYYSPAFTTHPTGRFSSCVSDTYI